MTERGDRVRVTSRTGSAQRFVGDLKKVRELEIRFRTETVDFWARSGETILRAMGAVQDRGQMDKTAYWDCVSPPYVETFNSKLIKRFRTWTRSRYVFLNFEIPMFFICSMYMCYKHAMSILHMAIFAYLALIVNMVQVLIPLVWQSVKEKEKLTFVLFRHFLSTQTVFFLNDSCILDPTLWVIPNIIQPWAFQVQGQ